MENLHVLNVEWKSGMLMEEYLHEEMYRFVNSIDMKCTLIL